MTLDPHEPDRSPRQAEEYDDSRHQRLQSEEAPKEKGDGERAADRLAGSWGATMAGFA